MTSIHDSTTSIDSRSKTGPGGVPLEDSIKEFREELEKLNIYDPERMDEHFLVRFLKARKFKIPDCVAMLQASEQWRVDFKVDEVVKEFVYSEAEEVSKLYKRYHHKTDKLGRPIYFEIFKQVLSSLAKQRKQMDLKKLMSVTSEERLVQHHVREYEKFTRYKLAACSKKAGKHLDQGFTVLDLQGIPLSSFPSVKRLGNEMSKISADNYPETMGILFVINAPMLFTAVWSVIKGWLDEATVKKIHILGSSYKDKLLEWVDPENLPVQYGGTCTCDCLGGCGNADVGPWNDGTVEGYPNLDWEFGIMRDDCKFATDEVRKLAKEKKDAEE